MGSQDLKQTNKMAGRQHMVFMYGTIKIGEPNNKHLYVKSQEGAAFYGDARTISKYPLIVTTPVNLPFLLHKEGVGNRITGEIFEVDEETLIYLDWLEGHPTWYERRQIQIEVLTDSDHHKLPEPKIIECWIYGLPRFKESLLELPQLEIYNNHLMESHRQFTQYIPGTDGPLNDYLFDD